MPGTPAQLTVKFNGKLPDMRRSTIWFLLAALWFLDLALVLFHHRWVNATVVAVVAIAFLLLGFYLRSKEFSRR